MSPVRLRKADRTRSTGDVDVIMPAFNAERTISKALQSVLDQTCQPARVIVVDDGSTDMTGAIVCDIARENPGVKLIRQDNAGPAAARNTAIDLCRSQFIAPIDADDMWDSDYLERQLAQLAINPSCAFSYSGHRILDDQSGTTKAANNLAIEGNAWLAMVLHNFVGNGSSMVFRRDLAEAVGGYKEPLSPFRGGEDYLFQLSLLRIGLVTCVQRVVVTYRAHDRSLSKNNRKMRDARVAAIRQSMLDGRHVDLRAFARVSRWARADAARVYAVQSIIEGHGLEALRFGMKALATDLPGTLSDFLQRIRNAINRRSGNLNTVASKIDPLLVRRLEILAEQGDFTVSQDWP